MAIVFSYDEYIVTLAGYMEVEWPATVNPYDSLYTDLGLDSFQAFQMIVITESMAFVDVPPIALPELFTAQDAYQYYVSLCGVPDS